MWQRAPLIFSCRLPRWSRESLAVQFSPSSPQLARRNITFRPAQVREVALTVEPESSLLQTDKPCVLRAPSSLTNSISDQSQRFMNALRQLGDRLVPVELGKYQSPDLERVHLPLSAYLDWLSQGGSTLQGKQLYLAQEASLWQDEPSLQAQLPMPLALHELVRNQQADLYQAAMFIGPIGAVSILLLSFQLSHSRADYVHLSRQLCTKTLHQISFRLFLPLKMLEKLFCLLLPSSKQHWVVYRDRLAILYLSIARFLQSRRCPM